MMDIIESAPDETALAHVLAAVHEQARTYAQGAKAPNTRHAYRADWADFTAWCRVHGRAPLPASPETVALYLTARAATRKTATLTRRLSAISQAHQVAGHPSPTTDQSVRAVAAGIRRAKGIAPHGKAPAVTAEVRAMVAALPDTLMGRRDRALLLLGFAGAFRRSELVALDGEDVVERPEGLAVTIRFSKTDQDGVGRTLGIPYGSHYESCPVRAWRDAAGIAMGPLFQAVDRHDNLLPGRLSDQDVARAVKRAARAAGLDATLYAGHSLRAGLATAASAAGVSARALRAQTGHKSLPPVRRYIRGGSLFRENAAAEVGL